MRVEQLVYGTFPFTQGFTLVSASAGISPALAARVVEVCKSWGEVLSADFRSALTHVPLEGTDEEPGRHLVTRVVRQGTDRGDRMAWFQQVLVIEAEDYRAGGADCFAYAEVGLFKERWFESDRCAALDLELRLLPSRPVTPLAPGETEIVERALSALRAGREVRVQAGRANRTVRRLFQAVLERLSPAERAAISLATFAYRPVRRYGFWCQHEPGGPIPESIGEIQVRVPRA